MAGSLEKFFVSVGVKGQDVVIKNIDKIKNEAKGLEKLKSVIDFGKSGLSKLLSKSFAPSGMIPPIAPKQQEEKPLTPEQKRNNREQTQATNKFVRGAGQFGNAANSIASSAAGLDPVAAIQSITSATAKIAGGWSAFGFSAGNTIEGIGDLMNSGIAMANSAVSAAKQAAAEQYSLSRRNVTTQFYGGGQVKKGGMSNPEHAELTMRIAGAFGKIQKPMADEINKLVRKKDTAALTGAAAGNWESTGTDRGFMLQQIINNTQGMLPSVAQKINAELLKSNADLIQGKTEGGVRTQGQREFAGWVAANEKQTANMFRATSEHISNLKGLNDKFNKIQVELTKSGAGLAACVDKMANSINGAVDKIRTGINK